MLVSIKDYKLYIFSKEKEMLPTVTSTGVYNSYIMSTPSNNLVRDVALSRICNRTSSSISGAWSVEKTTDARFSEIFGSRAV